jgi:hypothetical protein
MQSRSYNQPRVSETYRKNVSLWRVYNRRRWEFEKEGVGCDELVPFACECTSGDCLHAVDLTMHEYESGHMTPDWATVIPSHIMPDDGGQVVLKHPHFWVVELSPLRRRTGPGSELLPVWRRLVVDAPPPVRL